MTAFAAAAAATAAAVHHVVSCTAAAAAAAAVHLVVSCTAAAAAAASVMTTTAVKTLRRRDRRAWCGPAIRLHSQGGPHKTWWQNLRAWVLREGGSKGGSKGS